MKRLWTIVISVCAIVVLLCLMDTPAQAAEVTASGTCGDNLTWTLDSNHTLTISGTGAMANYTSESEVPWYSQRDLIWSVVVQNGVTSIGDSAFYGCGWMMDVSIGATVQSIGRYAFIDCTKLKSVMIPASVTDLKPYVFDGCSRLTNVTIEGSAPLIYTTTFAYTPETLTVKYYEGSDGYDDIDWADITLVPQHIGIWEVDVPATCTSAGTRHIYCTYCRENFTESYTIDHRYLGGICIYCQEAAIRTSGQFQSKTTWQLDVFGVLTISGDGAMDGWDAYWEVPWYRIRLSINTVNIQSGIINIGSYAFDGCTNLTSVTISDTVKYIEGHAFTNCSNLTAITLPDSVTDIGAHAFFGCKSLTTITIPDSVTSIGLYAFAYCRGLTTITIPDSVTRMGMSAFEYCSNLTSVIIPDSLTYLSYSMFSNCSSLTSVTIPNSVTDIGAHAFFGCKSLTTIIIPDSVTSIGDEVFEECRGLISVIFTGSAPSFDVCVFQNVSADVYYPCSDDTWIAPMQLTHGGVLTWRPIHSISKYSIVKAATCTSDVIISGACTDCDQWGIFTLPNTATGHSFHQNGICTVCGAVGEIIVYLHGYGWNGNALEIYEDDVLIATATISRGNSNRVMITCYPCRTYTFKWAKASAPEECSFDITLNNDVLFSATRSTCESYNDGETLYTIERSCEHSYVASFCIFCGNVLDYYLIGNINGMDYGCEQDYENLGQYKFVDGKLVATFTEDSYVFIKTGDNLKWFMASEYTTGTSVTLSDTSNGTQEKLFVPGGVKLTFTLVVNEDGSLTLSYEMGHTISGTVTNFGDDSDAVTVELVADGTVIQTSSSANFSFSNVASGSYVLQFSKENHVTREYPIDVGSGDVTLDATLCLTGDANGDGKVNMKDWNRLYEHLNEVSELTGYALQSTDVNKDGKVNMKDWNRIYEHLSETNPLW